MAIKLIGSVEKRTYGVTRKTRKVEYVAKIGNVEATGNTEKEASDALTVKVAALCANMTDPYVMFGFDGTVWILHPTTEGWGYSMAHPTDARHRMPTGASYMAGCGGSWGREEAITRMREHWYDNNARDIVDGIAALCGDWRQWICKRCTCPMRSHAPYRCTNPACGAEAHTFDW